VLANGNIAYSVLLRNQSLLQSCIPVRPESHTNYNYRLYNSENGRVETVDAENQIVA